MADLQPVEPDVTPTPNNKPDLRTAALPVDLIETDDALVLIANLPGVRAEDLNVSLEGNELALQADRHEPLPVHGDTSDSGDDTQPVALFRELGGVRWERRFRLRTPIDADNIEARLDAGVLQLTLPKAPEVRPRKIEIAVG